MKNKAVLEYPHSFFVKFKSLFHGILIHDDIIDAYSKCKINNIHLFLRLSVHFAKRSK